MLTHCYQKWHSIFLPNALEQFWVNFWPLWLILALLIALLLKYRRFPIIIIPIFLICSVLFIGFQGQIRGLYRFQLAKYEIGTFPENVFAQKTWTTKTGQWPRSQYVGDIDGLRVSAVSLLVPHDCQTGFLVRSKAAAMRNEFRSPDGQREQEIERLNFSYTDNMRLESVDRMSRVVMLSTDPPSTRRDAGFQFSWCKMVTDGYYFCEGENSRTDADAKGMQF